MNRAQTIYLCNKRKIINHDKIYNSNEFLSLFLVVVDFFFMWSPLIVQANMGMFLHWYHQILSIVS